MFSFVFFAGNDATASVVSPRMLASTGTRLQQGIPSLGQPLGLQVRRFPENNCGWCLVRPLDAADYSLVSEAVDDHFAVVAFGDTIDRRESCAARILAEWKQSSPQPVLDVEGCFSAVVVDRLGGGFFLVGDAIGQRVLYYYHSDRWLVASPHDMCLAATGIVPIRFDLASAVSIASVGWTLGAKSLLQDVEVVSPRNWIRMRNGRRDAIANPVFPVQGRVDVRDTQGLAQVRDRMIESMRSNLSTLLAGESQVQTELSAGLDSRAVLSLLLSVVPASRVTGFSAGSVKDLDVRVARRLAAETGIAFEHRMPEPPDVEDFPGHCDLLAFACNGDATSLVATTNSLPRFQHRPAVSLAGNGGEMYRGYYYPFEWNARRPVIGREDVLKRLHSKCNFSWCSAAVCEDLVTGVRRRLEAIVDELWETSANGYDVLDLFYLYERYGVWAAKSRRAFWNPWRWSPFSSRTTARLAFHLPAPIADFSRLHATAIRRFCPGVYRTLVNNELFLPLMDGSPWFRPVGKTIQACGRLHQRLDAKWRARRKLNDVNGLRAMYLQQCLRGSLWDSLTAQDSITVSLLGKPGIERMLDQQRQGTRDHTPFLGAMLTIDRWRGRVEQLSHAAHALSRVD